MLKFADLTKSQKTFIVRTLEKFPEYKSDKTLGAKQIHAAYFSMKDERGSTGEKLGYPNWLQNKNRVGRGQYEMPWPTDKELSDFAQPVVSQPKAKVVAKKGVMKPKAKVATKDVASSRLQSIVDESPVHEQEYEDFNQILRENGIEI